MGSLCGDIVNGLDTGGERKREALMEISSKSACGE